MYNYEDYSKSNASYYTMLALVFRGGCCGMAVEVETSRWYPVTCCYSETDDSRRAVRHNGI